jgi:hypothetical protein
MKLLGGTGVTVSVMGLVVASGWLFGGGLLAGGVALATWMWKQADTESEEALTKERVERELKESLEKAVVFFM